MVTGSTVVINFFFFWLEMSEDGTYFRILSYSSHLQYGRVERKLLIRDGVNVYVDCFL